MLLFSLLPKTLRKERLLSHLLPFLTPVGPLTVICTKWYLRLFSALSDRLSSLYELLPLILLFPTKPEVYSYSFPLYLIVLILHYTPVPFIGFLLFKQYMNLMNNIWHFLLGFFSVSSIFLKVDLRKGLHQWCRPWLLLWEQICKEMEIAWISVMFFYYYYLSK